MTPVITIFVRHNPACKHAGKAFHKGCDCPKHFRWYAEGKQHFRSAGVRSWAEAERKKTELTAQLSGEAPVTRKEKATSIRAAAFVFLADKKAQGVSESAYGKHKLDLERLAEFCEARGVFTVQAVTLPVLVEFRGTWDKWYGSSVSRMFMQKRIQMFFRFCKAAKYCPDELRLSPIRVTEPKTQPLTEKEYEALLEAVPLEFTNGNAARVRAVIQLMRWSGLAVRDATVLASGELLYSSNRVYHVTTDRQKTGVHVSVPIPAALALEIIAHPMTSPDYFFWDPKASTAQSAAAKMSQYISAVFKRAGVKCEGHMVSHRLRDTFAVDLLTKGVPLEDVSKLLGHESVTTTEKSYAPWVKGRQDRLTNIVTATWETTDANARK